MPIRLTPTKTANLLRSEAGIYYGRSKIGGKQVTKSFKIKNFRVAETMLRDWLQELASAAVVRIATPASDDAWGPCVDAWLERMRKRPELAAKTVGYYEGVAALVRKLAPAAARPRDISVAMVEDWWQDTAGKVSSNVANVAARIARDILHDQMARGLRRGNPAAGLKRMKRGTGQMALPSADDFARVLKYISGTYNIHAAESARYVRFLAYSGLRIGEAQGMTWERVEQTKAGTQLVVLSGKSRAGAINFRRVPCNPALLALLDEMRALWPEDAHGKRHPTGPLFHIISPRGALDAACIKLGIPHIRIHDLRHLFATTCIEAGVDIPTVARWLGHRDGGVLAMRVYGHLRDAHSAAAAAKVRF